MIKLLLDSGADPKFESKDYGNPDLWAVSADRLTLARLLINEDPNKYHTHRWTSLVWAAVGIGFGPMVRKLIDRGANPNFESSLQHITTRPLRADITYPDLDIAKLFIESGAASNKLCGDGWMPLQLAAHVKSEVMVEMLIERESSLDIEGPSHRTPLSRAVNSGHVSISKLLIERGANKALHHTNGWTPLRYAARKDQRK